jgi:hypothetical protein
VRSTLLTLFGLLSSLAYAVAIVWLYATQPRTLQEVATGARVAAGAYQVDEARMEAGRELFRHEQYGAARAEWQQADPARRDARVQFYVAYSFYREGWGRLHRDDRLYARGLEAVDRALALSAGQPLRVDDPELGIKTPVELRAELQAGVETSWGDLNPMRVLERRK